LTIRAVEREKERELVVLSSGLRIPRKVAARRDTNLCE
jgi:hypothetical protein